MRLDCTTPRYEELYAPWLKNPGTLLRLGRYLPGEALLDLCGGSGAVSRAALTYSVDAHKAAEPLTGGRPDVTLLDLNPRPSGPWSNKAQTFGHLRVKEGRAEDVGRLFPQRCFDLVVIRQALGYLNLEHVFHALAQVMKPGARLVFNSFADPLEGGVKRYSIKTYRYGGARFFEVHFAALGRVAHLQAKLSWKPGADVTLFKYHDAPTIVRALQPYFSYRMFQEGRSLRWLCVRQPFSYKDRYVEALLELAAIRERHGGEESEEEDRHLDEMDRLYWLCDDEEQEALNDSTILRAP